LQHLALGKSTDVWADYQEIAFRFIAISHAFFQSSDIAKAVSLLHCCFTHGQCFATYKDLVN